MPRAHFWETCSCGLLLGNSLELWLQFIFLRTVWIMES
uniref:Uncharacterized protein n=1 Tax=Arundo donax TaxID=35708 RepID=A0A0A8ZM87_ARUDO